MKTQTNPKILFVKLFLLQIATGENLSLTELQAHTKKGENIKLQNEIEKYLDKENIQKEVNEYFINISPKNYKIIIEKIQLFISKMDIKSKKI